MYPATAFHEVEVEPLLADLGMHPFVTLVAAVGGRLLVANAPVVVRRLEGGLALDFHLSRGNALAPALADGFRAVAVSLAADAYISPDWFESVDQVPTWNYVSVEIEGSVSALDGEGLVTLLDDLSAQEEHRLLPKPVWTRAKMSPGRFETMTRAIIGARLAVERLEGTNKLAQPRSDADRAGVIAALGDHPIARRMRGE